MTTCMLMLRKGAIIWIDKTDPNLRIYGMLVGGNEPT